MTWLRLLADFVLLGCGFVLGSWWAVRRIRRILGPAAKATLGRRIGLP